MICEVDREKGKRRNRRGVWQACVPPPAGGGEANGGDGRTATLCGARPRSRRAGGRMKSSTRRGVKKWKCVLRLLTLFYRLSGRRHVWICNRDGRKHRLLNGKIRCGWGGGGLRRAVTNTSIFTCGRLCTKRAAEMSPRCKVCFCSEQM